MWACHHRHCAVSLPNSSRAQFVARATAFLVAVAVIGCLWVQPAEGCDIAFFRHVVKTGGRWA